MKLSIIFSITTIVSITAQNIFRTACNGNLSRLDSLLTTTPIDTKDDYGQTLIHWAVACNKNEVFYYLLEKGLTTNAVNNNNRSALYMAVKYQNNTLLDTLMKLQPNTDWITAEGGSLMEIGVIRNNRDAIKTLISKGVDIDAKNERGNSPLHVAMRLDNTEMTELLTAMGADENLIKTPQMKGRYMGQKTPRVKAELFAPNFISTEAEEFGSVFNKAGTEFYYAAHLNGKSEIKFTKLENNIWSVPKTILVHEQYGYNDPFLSPDENRLYFISSRAMDGKGAPKDIDIWYVERQGEAWSDPINAGKNINTAGEDYYISFTNSGAMYFSTDGYYQSDSEDKNHDIYVSEFEKGKFQKARKLSSSVNTNAYEADVFVAPDESYLIFCSTRDGGFGQGDLYISFKTQNSEWSPAINMGEAVNTSNYEYCPFVSADGKYLFFTSNQDIYWVSTEVIQNLND